mgnify:CR=1 FL=1
MSTWTFSIRINGSTFVYEVVAQTEEEAEKKALQFFHTLDLPEEVEDDERN